MPTQFEVQVGINSKAIQKILDDGKTIIQLPELTGQLQSTDMVALYNVETGNTLKVTVAELIGALKASELGNDSSVPGTTVSDALDELNKKTRWRGQWAEGTYYSTDQVYDKGYLAIVKLGLNGTQQRPSPQALISAQWTLPDTPSWINGLIDDTVTQMLRISNVTGLASIEAFRIYIPDLSADAHYITFGIDNNTGVITDGKSYIGTDFDQIGWHEIPVPVTWFNIGADYSYYLRSNTFTEVTNENYQYFLPSPKNDEIPTSGQATRRGDNTEIQVNYTDDLNIDRNITIKSLSQGDTIRMIQNSETDKWIKYTVAENEDMGDYAKITVVIDGFGPNGTLSNNVTGTLELIFAVPEGTKYLTLDDYYLDADQISGGIAIGDTDMIPNQNACGLDFKYILYSVSTDWDIQAYPDTSSGGALPPQYIEDVFQGLGITIDKTYTQNPVILANMEEIDSALNKQIQLSGDTTITQDHNNTLIWCNAAGPIVLTMSLTNKANFSCEVWNIGTGAVSFVADVDVTINAVDDKVILATNKTCMIVQKQSEPNYYLKGELE